MTEHTPGPWYVTGDNIRADNHRECPGALLFIAGQVFDYEPVPGKVKANLHLAAASPDLLAALEALTDDDQCRLDHSGFCQTHTNEMDDGQCAMVVARAAIARAKMEN